MRGSARSFLSCTLRTSWLRLAFLRWPVERGAIGFRLLGVPIGTLLFVRAFCGSIFQRATVQIETALCMASAQERARVVFGAVAHRVTYLASLVPLLHVAPDLVYEWDASLRRVLQSCIQGVALTELGWELACLPPSDGGLGIPRLRDVAVRIMVRLALGDNF